jgi:putative lysine decarboxylase
MKVVTDGVQPSGERLTGISVGFLRKWVRKDAAEMTFTRDLAERKARLLAVSDAVMVMPGGVGTLREATEVLELRTHGPYNGPVVLLNSALPGRLRYRGGPCGVRRPRHRSRRGVPRFRRMAPPPQPRCRGAFTTAQAGGVHHGASRGRSPRRKPGAFTTAQAGGVHHGAGRGRVADPHAARVAYVPYLTFSDPDRNGWVVQEVKEPFPGR